MEDDKEGKEEEGGSSRRRKMRISRSVLDLWPHFLLLCNRLVGTLLLVSLSHVHTHKTKQYSTLLTILLAIPSKVMQKPETIITVIPTITVFFVTFEA